MDKYRPSIWVQRAQEDLNDTVIINTDPKNPENNNHIVLMKVVGHPFSFSGIVVFEVKEINYKGNVDLSSLLFEVSEDLLRTYTFKTGVLFAVRKKDIILQEFCKEHDLKLPDSYSDEFLFIDLIKAKNKIK